MNEKGKRAHYPENYNATLSSVCRQFSNWVLDNSQAKNGVLFGVKVLTRFLKDSHNRFWFMI